MSLLDIDFKKIKFSEIFTGVKSVTTSPDLPLLEYMTAILVFCRLKKHINLFKVFIWNEHFFREFASSVHCKNVS